MLLYRLAADVVLVAHASLIAFIIAGLVLTLAGWWRHWGWVGNFWFRVIHLGLIGYVVVESWFSLACPLTSWEDSLRMRAGQDPYSSAGCVADWLHRLIFFDASPWVFTICYSAFGLLVAATLILVPPRLPGRGGGLTPPAVG